RRGEPDLALGGLDDADRFPEGGARREVEGEGDGGELALVIDRERRAIAVEAAERAERHLGAGGRFDVERPERLRILLKGRRHLEDDVVLVQLGEDRRDLTLAER